jgi:beta-lactamase class A
VFFAQSIGANGEHTSNDIAVIWPPGYPPIVVAAYITQCFGPERKRSAMTIGELVKDAVL